MAQEAFNTVEDLQLEVLNINEYELGYLQFGIPLQLTDKQLEQLREAITKTYGPNAGIDYIPKTASFKLRIIDKIERGKNIHG